MPSTPSQHPSLSLEQHLAQLKVEYARLEDERNSFSRIATSSLRALRREIDRPSGFWIREEEEEAMLELERVSDLGEAAFHGGNWRWWTVDPAPISSPTFDMDVPLRLSIPSEIFEAIGSFADLPTRSSLSRVDLARLATLSPNAYPCLGFNDGWRLATLLENGLIQTSLSPRIKPSLSLRNVRSLLVSAHDLQNLFFSDDALDGMDSFGDPLRLTTLTILLHYEQDEERPRHDLHPIFEPSLPFLSFVDPSSLHFRDPLSFEARKEGEDLYGTYLTGGSVLLSLQASFIISRWTRLEHVHLHEVAVCFTQNDVPSFSISGSSFSLDFELSGDHGEDILRPLSVWWYCPNYESKWDKRAEEDDTPSTMYAMVQPVRLLLSRETSFNPRIERAFIVISDEKKRQRQEELLETYTEERRGPFQIVSSSEAAASLGR